MDIEQLKKDMAAALAAARALADQWKGKEAEMPKDISDQINGHLARYDELKAKLDLAERMQAGEEHMKQSAGTKAAHLGWRQAGPDEGMAAVDPQGWREFTVKTWEVDPRSGIVAEVERKQRFHVPVIVERKDYGVAVEAYLRRGVDRMGPNDRKTLSEGIDSAGGYLAPEDFHIELIKKLATLATIRANARVVQTSRDVASWPKIVYTTDDKYTSGVRLTWTGENPASSTAHRVTDPVFGLYKVPVHTAMASLPLTNDLLEDAAFDVMGIGTDLMSEAFTLGENDAFINGSGVTRPMGILTQVDGDGPASVVSGTASTLLADGLIDLVYALPAQYERNAKWLMAKSTEKVIRKLKDADNNYLWPIWPQQGGFAPAPRELLGFPVLKDEAMPAIAANAYPIIFGDLTGYLVLDRVAFTIQRLEELYAETNITLLLAKKRVGGLTVEPWRLKVQKVSA